MREKIFSAGIFFLLITGLLTATTAYGQFKLNNRAPDVLPGTTPEMRNPQFWVAKIKNPDDIVLTTGSIKKMNEDFINKIHSPNPFAGVSKERTPDLGHWWPGFEMAIPDLSGITKAALADTVRTKIDAEIKYLKSMPFGNMLGIKLSDKEIETFISDMSRDRIDGNIKLIPALTVRKTQLRNVPSITPLKGGLWDTGGIRWDMFNIGVLRIAEPISVLHRSKTGEFVFAQCADGYGWVKSEDVAFGNSESLKQFTDPENFVVCTGNRVFLYSDQSCAYVSEWFGMGDRLPAAGKGNARELKIPVRKADGQLASETVWLTTDADICKGWLPYTRRNVAVTAFKLLDEPFDWTGCWLGRNAESTYRDIFACFGFKLPYHGALFTHFGNNTKVALAPEGLSADSKNTNSGYSSGQKVEEVKKLYTEKFKMITGNEPLLTINILSNGHSQLYIGDIDGVPYVLDTHGYGYKGDDGVDYEIKRCCISNMAMGVPDYALKNPVLFLELK